MGAIAQTNHLVNTTGHLQRCQHAMPRLDAERDRGGWKKTQPGTFQGWKKTQPGTFHGWKQTQQAKWAERTHDVMGGNGSSSRP